MFFLTDGLFNANELLNSSLNTFRKSAKEDYYEIIPVELNPNADEVMGMYPAIDTAISKCTKVIVNHSMPSAENPAKKTEENNRWIDENWIAIGRAMYYRRDYDEAIKNFEFVRKFFKKDPSNYVATLWIAKCQLQIGDLSGAQLNLDQLDLAAENTRSGEEASKGGIEKKKKMSRAAKKRKKAQAKKNKKKEEALKEAEFPSSLFFELEKTKGDLAIHRKEYEKAIEFLEKSLEYAKKKDKARINYVLAQLNQKLGKNQEAKDYYSQVLKYNSTYEMNFNARISRAFVGGDVKIKKQLEKMSKDPKNAEYRDQIYYALADIELQESKKDKAIYYLHRSTFYSTTNTKQKGRSYEKLGDISFKDKNYVNAQKYYDSCGRVINDTYPNAEAIRRKASKLSKLVEAIEVAHYEDSVQRIAKLSPEEREEFANNVVKKLKEEEAARKIQEAQKLKDIQDQQNANQDAFSGNKSYWNNPKLKNQGFDEFRKQWGQRENEDDWRRSDKIITAVSMNTDNGNSGTTNSKGEEGSGSSQKEKDAYTGPSAEQLLANIPEGDSAIAASNERLVEALYDAGMIYKEQLLEPALAKQQFESVLARNFESEFNVMSAFQLYKLDETTNSAAADQQKQYILTYFPNSDYANYLRDPDYFIKKKEIDKINEQDYVRVLDRYSRKLYYPVISKANEVIEGEPNNIYRSKYMLLKAMSMGQLSDDKSGIVPVLDQLIAEYPNTPEEARAKEFLNIIKNGFSKNVEVDFNKEKRYKEGGDENDMWIVIYTNASDEKNFNKEFFSKNKLVTDSRLIGDKNILTVKSMNKKDCQTYIRKFKTTKKHLGTLMNAKIVFISKDNLKILLESKDIEGYDDFFLEQY